MTTATAVKERPILFSGPMVKAILDGRKTMTRRVVKPQPDEVLDGEPYWNIGGFRARPMAENRLLCKYGQAGDRLWVRESFDVWMRGEDAGSPRIIKYMADGETHNRPWRPSIHMPRSLSRITLEITDVGIQRLQDISEQDAQAEGVGGMRDMRFMTALGNIHSSGHRLNFIDLWNSINGADSWDANPWVWVVSFKRIDQ
jgi:hypothetical protein